MIQDRRRFHFFTQALPDSTFGVVRFRAFEGLSQTYRLELELISTQEHLDGTQLLASPAEFRILREAGDIRFHGILREFTLGHRQGPYTFCRTVLEPRLSWLGMTQHHQVFLSQSLPDILQTCLRDMGLNPGVDFEFRLKESYRQKDFLCQYRESHLDFLWRWMAQEGLYAFFEQGEEREKLILTDTMDAHTFMAEGSLLKYAQPSGLAWFHRDEEIYGFKVSRHLLPQKTEVRDYAWESPSLELQADQLVDPAGRGLDYHYGLGFKTPAEGRRLAHIRAQSLQCRKLLASGEATVPFLRPGYRFQMEGHDRQDFNREWLTISLVHEGSQAAYLLSGLNVNLSTLEKETYYRCRFEAIPAEVQFRTPPEQAKPRITGYLPARIDGAGSKDLPHLDEQGRYKLILPFDLSGRKEGKASHWVRRMQPYGGQDRGLHFPLPKETEVLLLFQEGNPDRPLIAGALPHPESPSPVHSENQTRNVIRTASGNTFHMEDQEGSQRIQMEVPKHQTFVRMGAPNDPVGDWIKKSFDEAKGGKAGQTFSTPGWISVFGGFSNSVCLVMNNAFVLGMDNKLVAGWRIDTTLVYRMNICLWYQWDFSLGGKWTLGTSLTEMKYSKDQALIDKQTLAANNSKAVAQRNRTLAAHRKTIAQHDAAIAQSNSAIGTSEHVIGQKNEAIANEQEALLAAQDTIAQQTLAIANQNEALNNASLAVATSANIDGSVTTIRESKNATGAIKNGVQGVHNTLTTSMIVI